MMVRSCSYMMNQILKLNTSIHVAKIGADTLGKKEES